MTEVNRASVEKELVRYFKDQPEALAAALSEVDSYFTFSAYAAGLSRSTGIKDPEQALLFWAKKRGERWLLMIR
ncbi:MAG: hypothetical protein AAF623_00115 [Planctomycetota bacterium]